MLEQTTSPLELLSSVETMQTLTDRVNRKMSNKSNRWTADQLKDAFEDALRSALPLGPIVAFEEAGNDDGVWEIPRHVTRLIAVSASAGVFGHTMVPLGAVTLSHYGPVRTRIKLPYGCSNNVTLRVEAMCATTYPNFDNPGSVIDFPWPDILEDYMKAALYEQRVDLLTQSDGEVYAWGMQTWRTRADIRKQELLSSLLGVPADDKPKGRSR